MRTRKQTNSNLVNDLVATRLPLSVARAESIRVTALAQALRARRITLPEALAQLRGAA